MADNEDVDYYVVEAKKGERIAAEVEGIRLGATFFDPYVAILDAKRFELASATTRRWSGRTPSPRSSRPRTARTSSWSARAPTPGNSQCLYRLHVGNFPRPTAVVPGRRQARRDGRRPLDRRRARRDDGARSRLPAQAETRLRHLRPGRRGDRPLPQRVPALALRQRDRGRAERRRGDGDTVHRPPGLQRRDRQARGRRSVRLHGQEGQIATRSGSSPARSARRSTRSSRSPRKGGGHRPQRRRQRVARQLAPVQRPGRRRVRHRDPGPLLQKGGPDYFYRIEVAPVEPQLTLSVPNESLYQRRNQPIAVAVPKGNRQAILVNATRTGFSGELAIEAQGLPAGVTLEADPMAAGLGTYPVLFHAAADAPAGRGPGHRHGQADRSQGERSLPSSSMPTSWSSARTTCRSGPGPRTGSRSP